MVQSEFTPKTQRVLATVLALAIGGLTFAAMPLRDLRSTPQATAADIDFPALHRQASDALGRLNRLSSPDAF